MENKERQRYLLFQLISEGNIEKAELIRSVWRQLHQLYGEVGTSQTGLWLIEYEKNRYGIIRTNIKSLQMIRTTLAVIQNIEGVKCMFVIHGVSGTIKSLRRKKNGRKASIRT